MDGLKINDEVSEMKTILDEFQTNQRKSNAIRN